MLGSSSEIDAALASEGPIPKDRVLSWMKSTADSDLSTLAKLYRLTGEGYYRIQPELGMESTCLLIKRYLLGCIRDGVTGDEDVQERYEAAHTLHVWFRHLATVDGTSVVLASAADAVTNLYLESSQEVRDSIETGFLEHVLETGALRQYFARWASDAQLQPAWNRALVWGEAHPDYMAGIFERLQKLLQEGGE